MERNPFKDDPIVKKLTAERDKHPTLSDKWCELDLQISERHGIIIKTSSLSHIDDFKKQLARYEAEKADLIGKPNVEDEIQDIENACKHLRNIIAGFKAIHETPEDFSPPSEN